MVSTAGLVKGVSNLMGTKFYIKARACNQHYYEHQRRKIATRFHFPHESNRSNKQGTSFAKLLFYVLLNNNF